MREVGRAIGEVNTAHTGGGRGHEVVAAVANAYGFVWGNVEGVECFVDEVGAGFYGAIVSAEGYIKGAIESVDHAVHGGAVVVGDQAEFVVACSQCVDEFCCASANGGVLCGFPFFWRRISLACLRCFAGKLSMCSMMVFSGGQLIFDRNSGQLIYDSVSVPSMSKMMARIMGIGN